MKINLIVVCFFTLICGSVHAKAVDNVFKNYLKIGAFNTVTESLDLSVDKVKVYRFKGLNTKNNDIIHIDIYSYGTEDIIRKVSGLYKRMSNLYNPNYTPYSASVSNKSACPSSEFIRTFKYKFKLQEIDVFQAPVTKNFTFGDCDVKKANLTGYYFVYVDQTNKLIIEVRFLGDWKNFEKNYIEI